MMERWEFAIWNKDFCSPKYIFMTFESRWRGISDEISVAHTVLSNKENFNTKGRGDPTDIYITKNALEVIDKIEKKLDNCPVHDRENNTLFGLKIRTLEDFQSKYDELYGIKED